MSEIEKAIETLRKISDIETSKRYRELHEIKCFNYDLLTAIQALQEKLERENPQPLGLEELKNKGGEPYFHVSFNGNKNEWVILDKHISKHPEDYNYGKTWLAYRHKPDLVNVNKIEHIGEANNMLEGE